MGDEWGETASRLAALREVRSRSTVLERAREGLGRDLAGLQDEARLLGEAREETLRLEEERAARLAEVAAVEADLDLLGVVVGQGEAALQATEHRAIKRYLVFCRERERVCGLRQALGLEAAPPLEEPTEQELEAIAAKLGVELGRREKRGRQRLCSFCESKLQRRQSHCQQCAQRCKAGGAT